MRTNSHATRDQPQPLKQTFTAEFIKNNVKSPLQKNKTPYTTWLHCLASVILCAVATSHIGMLSYTDFHKELPNLVLPFLSNQTLSIIGLSMEMSVGFYAYIKRGSDSTNWIVLFMVGFLIWYRLSLRSLTTAPCN